jgi:hypothetical protein
MSRQLRNAVFGNSPAEGAPSLVSISCQGIQTGVDVPSLTKGETKSPRPSSEVATVTFFRSMAVRKTLKGPPFGTMNIVCFGHLFHCSFF